MNIKGKNKKANPSDVYEDSIRIKKKANQHTSIRTGIEEGETYTIIPDPKNKDELFERFEKLHSQKLFEAMQRAFFKKYGEGNKKIIQDELDDLNQFIEKANTLSVKETFKNNTLSALDEYSRLVNGYYNTKPFINHVFSFFNNDAVEIYARYFLYKDWLVNRLKGLETSISTIKTKSTLSLPQIALIHAYNQKPIRRDNGKSIAKEHHWIANTSGERLYQLYLKYINTNDRKGDEGSKRKNQYKLRLIQSILDHLPKANKDKAIDEIKCLQNILEIY